MLDIYPSPMNIHLLKKIPSNANINVGSFHHDIVEQNSKEAEIYCLLYLPYVYQEPTLLKIDKGDKINIGNIPFK